VFNEYEVAIFTPTYEADSSQAKLVEKISGLGRLIRPLTPKINDYNLCLAVILSSSEHKLS